MRTREPGARLLVFSVRSRIVASILVTAAVGMTVAGLTAFLVQRDRILDGIDDRLVSRIESARVIATGVPPVDEESDAVAPASGAGTFTTTRDALEGVLAQLVPDRNETALGILDGQATFVPGVAVDFRLDDDAAFVERVVVESAEGAVKVGTAVTSVGTVRYIASPITVAGDPQVGVYVTAVDVDAALKELTDSFTTYAIAAALACAAIGLVGWFVAGRLLRPITQLRSAAARITATDRGERVTILGNDDVSAAGVTVNGMLDRLDLALTSQRQLLDDVRHELKTPITIVRGHLELLDAGNADDVESTRALALDELDRMSGLVDDIEALADAQVVVPKVRPEDAAELTRRVFEKASGMPNHRWLLAETVEAVVELDSRLVTQAWLQLIDNASKYSPAWSTVTIGSSRRHDEEQGDSVEFWVVDEGLGIPEGSEQRIFERFGRVDGGRGIRGSGLGLPIVMAIANAHGGTVSLTTSPQGSRFGIVVPLHRVLEPSSAAVSR